jgi:transcription antitermination factor NusG
MVLAALFRGRPESSGAHAGDGRWAQRLLNTVQDAASDVILYDTTGFIEVRQDGRSSTPSSTDFNLPRSWPALAVRPNLAFSVDQLVAFIDDGFVEALGRIEAIDRAACTVTVETPLARPKATAVVHLGDVHLDPDTYQDRRP